MAIIALFEAIIVLATYLESSVVNKGSYFLTLRLRSKDLREFRTLFIEEVKYLF